MKSMYGTPLASVRTRYPRRSVTGGSWVTTPSCTSAPWAVQIDTRLPASAVQSATVKVSAVFDSMSRSSPHPGPDTTRTSPPCSWLVVQPAPVTVPVVAVAASRGSASRIWRAEATSGPIAAPAGPAAVSAILAAPTAIAAPPSAPALRDSGRLTAARSK